MRGDGTAEGFDVGGSAQRFDAGRYVTRSRRLADLSQRELAEHLGVASSTVARWENGQLVMRVEVLADILGLAGLRLQVVDVDGRTMPPFDADSVRDNAGRRFPAHLDVVPPDQRPDNRGLASRRDRAPARGWYARRAERDSGHRQGDHPTTVAMAARAEELRHAALARARSRVVLKPVAACSCIADCFGVAGCDPSCPCCCEPVVPQLGPRVSA